MSVPLSHTSGSSSFSALVAKRFHAAFRPPSQRPRSPAIRAMGPRRDGVRRPSSSACGSSAGGSTFPAPSMSLKASRRIRSEPLERTWRNTSMTAALSTDARGSGGQGSGRAESARGVWYPASPQTACTPAARSSLSASAFSEPSRVAAMACVSRPGSLSSAGSSGGRLSVPSSACMVRKGMFMGGLLLATAGNRTFRAPTRLGAETGLRPIRPRRSGGVRRLA